MFFFFNDTATTEIYTLSLHDALPISCARGRLALAQHLPPALRFDLGRLRRVDELRQHLDEALRLVDIDRKSTRLNSSHANISYAVFCLEKKTHLPYAFFTHLFTNRPA